MRSSTLIFLTIISTILAQQPQFIRIQYYNLFPNYRVTHAFINDSYQPLLIETTGFTLFDNVETIHVTADTIGDVQIDVPHSELTKSFSNLRAIVIPNSKVKRIDENSFEICEKLETLGFDNNLIEEIPSGVFKNCSNVEWLTFVNNSISKIDEDGFMGLTSLNWLDLINNQISSIPSGFLKHTPSLEHLRLSGNPILQINPSAFTPSLLTMDFDGCQITQLTNETFANLPLLSVLHLNSNPINELPPNVFTSLTAITQIHLESTNIRRLNSNSFGRLENLTYLVLASSALDEIQPDFFDHFPAMQQFDAKDTICADVIVYNVSNINFYEDKRLHQCFANWFVARETTTTTEAPVDDSGSGLKISAMIIFVGVVSALWN